MQLVSDEDLTNMIPTLTQDSVEETPMNMSSRAYRMERVSLNEKSHGGKPSLLAMFTVRFRRFFLHKTGGLNKLIEPVLHLTNRKTRLS